MDFSFRPEEFIVCEDPEDLKGNTSAGEQLGYGCSKVNEANALRFLHKLSKISTEQLS